MLTRLLFILIILAGPTARAQQADRLVVVTLDGFRWQELFNGADSALLTDSKFTREKDEYIRKYWDPSPMVRRQKLMPFFWNVLAAQGQVHGNRRYGNLLNNANPHWFSYPGYNEIFTGYPDSMVNSNDKVWNPHINVLEFLQQQPDYRGSVAAFTSWDVFPFILNEERSGVYVNSGFEDIPMRVSAERDLIQRMQELTYRPLGDGVRPDLQTYLAAKYYLRTYQPKVLYIGFDETDDYAHGGRYDMYLQAAAMTDRMLADLWAFLQADVNYRGRTALVITTDHGRGDRIKEQWKDHGRKVSDAGQIWCFVAGPGVVPLGELRTEATHFQSQLAATMAALLGLTFTANHPVAGPLPVTSK